MSIIDITYKYTKIVDCGNIKNVIQYSAKNNKINIKKIDANSYQIISTGEVKKYKKGLTRDNQLKGIKQSISKLRDLINTNITDTSKAKFLTLTYEENMTDSKRLYQDFKKFNMRLRFLNYDYEYITVAEPQKRGAWHLHVLLLFKSKAPFIPSNLIAKVWGNGFVRLNKIDNCNNVGAYLSAYLTNLKDGKKTKKGKRLNLYPNKFNLYRCSKGIKKPTIKWYFTADLLKIKDLDGFKKTYSKVKIIELENGQTLQLNYLQYNKTIKEKQSVLCRESLLTAGRTVLGFFAKGSPTPIDQLTKAGAPFVTA